MLVPADFTTVCSTGRTSAMGWGALALVWNGWPHLAYCPCAATLVRGPRWDQVIVTHWLALAVRKI
eukprot:4012985-Amphidinium_carterae.1